MVSNRDIGFVHSGQPAEIKVSAFDSARSRPCCMARSLNISPDAVVRDKPAEKFDLRRPELVDSVTQRA